MTAYRPDHLALTGGTGALGFAFLRAQFSRQPELRATLLVRRASASFQSPDFQAWLAAHADRLTLIDGDIRELGRDELKRLLETDGGLWHFAALTSLTAESEEIAQRIREINVGGTERLLEAALTLGTASPFYHISTAYVVGERRGVALETESGAGQKFRNPYEASKLEAELAVNRAFASGLTGAIFRPSVVVEDTAGTGGFKMVDACAYAVALAVTRDEPFIFRLSETARLNLVHSTWVIAAMGDLARLPAGPGLTYHLTSPKPTYLREIVSVLEKRVPNLKMSFEPQLQRVNLPSASKIFDKAVTELRPYLESGVDFDRTQTVRDLSPDLTQAPLDLAPFVDRRLTSELATLARRKAGA